VEDLQTLGKKREKRKTMTYVIVLTPSSHWFATQTGPFLPLEEKKQISHLVFIFFVDCSIFWLGRLES